MSSRAKGIVSIIGAALSFALMGTFVHLAGDVPSMQKAFFRNVVAAFFSLIIMLKNHEPFHPPKPSHWIYLMTRAVFGTIGLICNFYAVDHLTLSDASMLNKMSPFFAIIVSYFLLKEKLNLVQAVSVVLAFLGSLLIIKPNPSNMALVPSLVGLLGGFGAGVAYAFVRFMSKKDIHSSLIIFVFSVFSCVVCLPFFLTTHVSMTLGQLSCLLMAGVFACSGQFCVTNAYRFAPAKEISVYDYTQVIFSALLGWLLFGQLPDGWSILGYVVICGMGVFMFLYQKRRDPVLPA